MSVDTSAAPTAVDHLDTKNLDAKNLDTGHLDTKLGALRARIDGLGSIVVAFSGGADSALLAWVAHQQLGDHAIAVTARSPSLPTAELAACEELAASWGMTWSAVATHELERPDYRANDLDRCYHCKAELMDVVGPIAQAHSAALALGVNLDDLDDHRPGQRAALEAGAVFPLVDAGLTKDEVRALSRRLGLSTWNKPAAACLASRVPYGTEVTVSVLSRVERAEAALHALGFADCRVRHHGDVARIEVPVERIGDVVDRRDEVAGACRVAGYRFVSLDLDGYRQGAFNPA